jgi:hypothetical protein
VAGGSGGNTNTYYVNSISETGQGKIIVSPPGPVVINVIGNNNTSPINLTGGSVVNNSTANNFVINYAGTGTVSLKGNSSANVMVYAPAANVQMVGTSDIYGCIIGGTVANNGTPAVHFDRALRNTSLMVGQEEIVSWNRTIN